MNVLRYRSLWYVASGIVVLASIAALGFFGLKFGVDFTGGSLLSVRYDQARPSSVGVERTLAPLALGELTIQPVGEKDVNIRLKTIEEETHQKIVSALRQAHGGVTELQYNAIGPTIGTELRQKSVTALLVIFIAILAFIAWSFRGVSIPMQSWKYGVIVLVTAFHDIAIPLGVFAVLGKWGGVEIGTPFIAAILTVMGYSINDTIVVLDRVRENLQKTSGTFEEIVQRSLNQTIVRSFNTSVTTVLAMIAVYAFGGESIKYFALALILGIITGTYSSIFIASPLLVSWNRFHRRAKKV